MPPSSPPVLIQDRAPERLSQNELTAPLLVGFSGGGDSLALLHLLTEAARGRKVIAAIVDHALRAESAEEASRAAAMASDLGVEPVVVRLTWPDGEKRAQEAARLARHRALARLARRHGARSIFLGHTRDDQAETVLMRREAVSGASGLAGMSPLAPSPVWPEGRDVWIARPLLDVSRAALRAHLRASGLTWIDDPTNTLERYARIRARRTLLESGETEPLLSLAHDMAREREAADQAARRAVQDHVRYAEGAAFIARDMLDAPGAAAALAAVALAVGGGKRPPPPDAAGQLRKRLLAGDVAHLGGARFRGGADVIAVTRDIGGVHGRRGGGRAHPVLPLPEGEAVVWDNRLELTARAPGWAAMPARDGRSTAPDFQRHRVADDPGESVDRVWLLETRVQQLVRSAQAPDFRELFIFLHAALRGVC